MELERRGLRLNDALWSARVLLEAPAEIENVHLDYLNAGARCLTTASFQASFMGFAQAGIAKERAAAAFSTSVEIAKSARGKFIAANPAAQKPFVAASVGPFGAALADGSEFHGNYSCSRDELVEFHASRLTVLASAAPDLFACETLPSLEEAEAILSALPPTGVPAWFSFTCRDGAHTARGDAIRDCARRLDAHPSVVAIGVNCTAPQFISPLIREIRSATSKLIVVYPNAGQKWNAEAKIWEGAASSLDVSEMAEEWLRLGANWIGGCCGVGPAEIRALARRVAASA